ncbi:DUF881 domain-containing protein [Desulfitobacterium chlororespirans]|uniref:Uncharacterized conserved protein YlxW, UPF0749 family n=1 Tax=Desulfitobacterium chlororespirans DSM 11544 TaxID=1121395 RepID=A0A1M7TIT1_9FIRM|nr:DUF881 domain-containing protein [Desulfitobacterium chlororespirans]SHN70662.1 Uncharacterized conserved protein YlxW, UPF0749 family [Desulfitobacterium chlororespirans DSM 11544]
MKKRTLAISLTLVALVLGFLLTLQMQTQKSVVELEKIQAQRAASAKDFLAEAQEENKLLKEQHTALTTQLEEARTQGGTSPALLAELDRYRMMEGTMNVQGPGIVITIDDRQQEHKVVLPMSNEDLLEIINTLKFAGAEAISVNGQRVVASSAIVLSGTSTKLINQVPITRTEGVPYEILACGNQDQLLDYFTQLKAQRLKQLGMSVSVARKTVQIPSYKGVSPVKNPDS